MNSSQAEDPTQESRPPVLGRWSRIYALVIANLVGMILLFYWFTIAFNE